MGITPGPIDVLTGPAQAELYHASCDCCGLTEECTPSYIETIQERYGGKWICGLCAEAVKDETLRCRHQISPDEALARHLSFCSKFRASGPSADPAADLIRALGRLLRKSLEGPESLRSTPSSPVAKRGNLNMKGSLMSRSEGCIPSLALVSISDDCQS